MEKQQPQPPMQVPIATAAGKKMKSKRMSSAQEIVTHYEKQGMATTTEEASLKVIGDLQGALFRMIKSSSNSNSPVISAKLDAVHSRLLQLEAQLPADPGCRRRLYLGTLQLWNAVRRVTSSDPPF